MSPDPQGEGEVACKLAASIGSLDEQPRSGVEEVPCEVGLREDDSWSYHAEFDY
jgi:hypothetical protein